jgi:hypothetical protein
MEDLSTAVGFAPGSKVSPSARGNRVMPMRWQGTCRATKRHDAEIGSATFAIRATSGKLCPGSPAGGDPVATPQKRPRTAAESPRGRLRDTRALEAYPSGRAGVVGASEIAAAIPAAKTPYVMFHSAERGIFDIPNCFCANFTG